MPPLYMDQRFESLEEFRTKFREWGVEANFLTAVVDSDSRRVRGRCRSSKTCPFKVRCSFSKRSGCARITILEDVHDCYDNPIVGSYTRVKRSEVCKMGFLRKAVPELMVVDRATKTKDIVKAIEEKYGQQVPLSQAQVLKNKLLGAKTWPRCRTCRHRHHGNGKCREGPPPVEEGDSDDADADGLFDDENEEHPESTDPAPPPRKRRKRSPPGGPTGIGNIVFSSDIAKDPNLHAALRTLKGQNLPIPSLSNFNSRHSAHFEVTRLMNRSAQLTNEAALYRAQAACLTALLASEREGSPVVPLSNVTNTRPAPASTNMDVSPTPPGPANGMSLPQRPPSSNGLSIPATSPSVISMSTPPVPPSTTNGMDTPPLPPSNNRMSVSPLPPSNNLKSMPSFPGPINRISVSPRPPISNSTGMPHGHPPSNTLNIPPPSFSNIVGVPSISPSPTGMSVPFMSSLPDGPGVRTLLPSSNSSGFRPLLPAPPKPKVPIRRSIYSMY